MPDSTKRRPRKTSPVELTISVLTAHGDPPEFIARWLGITPEEVERRLRQPRIQAMVEQSRKLQAEPPEERMARWSKRAEEIIDDWLRELDTSGSLPN